MRSDQEIFDLILNVAKSDPRVMAVLLNGSRANPNAPKDKYQDFDIVYVVTEMESWLKDNSWIDVFGDRIMLQMPETMRNPENDGNFGYLMLFKDGHRIDLTLMPIGNLNMSDKMTVVLLDKSKQLPDVEPSSDRDYHVKRPTLLEYNSCSNNFLWCLQNVAKGIARDELPYAMEMFNNVVREELNTMTAWYIGTLTDFSVSAGKMGKYFKRHLPSEVYQMIKATYSDSDYAHLWSAMFMAVECFEFMAKVVGEKMNYFYNQQDHDNMVNYLSRIKSELNGESHHGKGN
ncbi:MAG: aminoglycoside 6-adenylyltransferase [Erysipelotrichaceae bacterium]|nr:aminoglycoside 6-adenylyltransferase [Erysipelotrichaceae bacterium]